MIARFALMTVLVFSNSAFAQGASGGSPPEPTYVAGAVTAIDGTGVTLKDNDGAEIKLAVAPNATWLGLRLIDRTEIKPGVTVITGTREQPDGTQHAFGFRVVEPGSPMFGRGGEPKPPPGGTMTRGTVTKVTKTAAGHEIDIAHDGGTRHVFLPANVQPVSSFSADRTLLKLKVGSRVRTLVVRRPDGVMSADEIFVMLPAAKP